MEINFAAVIDALRALAVARGASIPQGNMPLFNRMFLKTVETYGRAYDLQMIMGYKLGSGSIMEDVEKFPTMIRKGKMAILPPAGADKHKAKRIIKKTQQDKGIKK
jgi:heterodisulfide reductase subunit C